MDITRNDFAELLQLKVDVDMLKFKVNLMEQTLEQLKPKQSKLGRPKGSKNKKLWTKTVNDYIIDGDD